MLPFGKYQGLGNDFLIVDLRAERPAPSPDREDEDGFSIARWLCDRRLGVGGDGVLTVEPPRSDAAQASMRVLNADGSEAQMCGNGLRCVVKYLLEDGESQTTAITIDTGAGALLCTAARQEGKVVSVTANMGRPRLLRSEIPMLGNPAATCLEEDYVLGTRKLALTAVSMGNPHAICFVPESGPALMALAQELGPALETHGDFPQRCNAEFVHVLGPSTLDLVVWERGVGITQACGTGACATAVAACKAGHCEVGTEIEVRLPGGSLFITVDREYRDVSMRGPAEHVFDGHVDLSRFD